MCVCAQLELCEFVVSPKRRGQKNPATKTSDKMDTCEAVRFYVDKMLTTGDNNGMKVLLFDEETLRMMGLVFSRHLILERGVFLHDYLKSTTRKKMSFLLGIVFVRPTKENIGLLKKELADPKYVF